MQTFIPPDARVTDRFTIRSYEPGDGPRLAAATNTSYDHLKTFMPWAKPHQSDMDAELLCRRFRGEYLLNKEFTLGIFTPDGKALLGSTGFHLRNRTIESGYGEIGMWIHGEAAGQGLGTSVLIALLEWGFTDWPWERLEWRCNVENRASARVAEKAGMLREGCLRADSPWGDGRRDTLLFGALRSEWRRPV